MNQQKIIIKTKKNLLVKKTLGFVGVRHRQIFNNQGK